jgi:hypothetical protein
MAASGQLVLYISQGDLHQHLQSIYPEDILSPDMHGLLNNQF